MDDDQKPVIPVELRDTGERTIFPTKTDDEINAEVFDLMGTVMKQQADGWSAQRTIAELRKLAEDLMYDELGYSAEQVAAKFEEREL